MAGQAAAEFEELVDGLKKGRFRRIPAVEEVVLTLARRFGVNADEASLMELAPSRRVVPEKLR